MKVSALGFEPVQMPCGIAPAISRAGVNLIIPIAGKRGKIKSTNPVRIEPKKVKNLYFLALPLQTSSNCFNIAFTSNGL